MVFNISPLKLPLKLPLKILKDFQGSKPFLVEQLQLGEGVRF